MRPWNPQQQRPPPHQASSENILVRRVFEEIQMGKNTCTDLNAYANTWYKINAKTILSPLSAYTKVEHVHLCYRDHYVQMGVPCHLIWVVVGYHPHLVQRLVAVSISGILNPDIISILTTKLTSIASSTCQHLTVPSCAENEKSPEPVGSADTLTTGARCPRRL